MKPAGKRTTVDHLRAAWQVSVRRACQRVPKLRELRSDQFIELQPAAVVDQRKTAHFSVYPELSAVRLEVRTTRPEPFHRRQQMTVVQYQQLVRHSLIIFSGNMTVNRHAKGNVRPIGLSIKGMRWILPFP